MTVKVSPKVSPKVAEKVSVIVSPYVTANVSEQVSGILSVIVTAYAAMPGTVRSSRLTDWLSMLAYKSHIREHTLISPYQPPYLIGAVH